MSAQAGTGDWRDKSCHFSSLKAAGRLPGCLMRGRSLSGGRSDPTITSPFSSPPTPASPPLSKQVGFYTVSVRLSQAQLYPAGDSVTFEGATRNTSGVSNWVARQLRLRSDQKNEL